MLETSLALLLQRKKSSLIQMGHWLSKQDFCVAFLSLMGISIKII